VLRELKLRGLGEAHPGGRAQGAGAPVGRRDATALRRDFQFIEPSLAATSAVAQRPAGEKENLWRMHDQVICSLDSVKPMEASARLEPGATQHLQPRALRGPDLGVVGSGHHRRAHRMGGSTEQVARYKLGEALAQASPYLLLLSATPHQGKTDQFMRLMQFLDREAFPDDEQRQPRQRAALRHPHREAPRDRRRWEAAVQAALHQLRRWLAGLARRSSACTRRSPTTCATATTRRWRPSSRTSAS
jgi:hypothetical protein